MTEHEKRALRLVTDLKSWLGPNPDEAGAVQVAKHDLEGAYTEGFESGYKQGLADASEDAEKLFEELIKKAHDAGYAAGLKARLPSREESTAARIKWATQIADMQFSDDDKRREQIPSLGIVPWDTCYDWLAANMRKGDE